MQQFSMIRLSTKALKALILFSSCFASSYANSYANSYAASANDGIRKMLQGQAQAYVQQNAVLYEQADIAINAMSIDPRVKIPVCTDMFNFEASETSLRQANVSVKITCPSSDWYLFTNVRVTQTKPVVVATDILSPGVLLTKENTELVDTDISRLRASSFSFVEDLEGARLKRRIRPGQIISRNMLCFVCKGDRITISASTSGLSLRASGIAQQDGNLGDTIKVKNIASKKLVSAIVSSTEEVQVAF